MTDKARVLAALERGDVSPTDFLLPDVVDGGKPILRVGARILDLRRDGYGIETVQTHPTALYRLISLPSPTACLDTAPEAKNGDRAMGGPVAVPHSGIDLELDGLGPDIPACPPAWQRSGLNPMEGTPDVPFGAGRYTDYAEPDEDGVDWWEAA